MTQPLFLKSVFQEKIWGGDHLKTFGYDLPTDKIGEYWAISAHPNGLSTVKNGEFAGQTKFLDSSIITQGLWERVNVQFVQQMST